jgi:hypothetical protein
VTLEQAIKKIEGWIEDNSSVSLDCRCSGCLPPRIIRFAIESLTAWLDEHKRVYEHLFECPPADCSWDIQRKNVESALISIAKEIEGK